MKDISIVIPVCNEEANIQPLYLEIISSLETEMDSIEIIFINDGSSDYTKNEIVTLTRNDKRVLLIDLVNNQGQGIAIFKGIHVAKFETICILDGDRQFFAKDILKFIEEKSKGKFDFVCGHRLQRSDDVLLKILPSIIGNKFISFLFKTDFEDIGCSLKVVQKKDCIDLVPFKNIHRYINILLALKGHQYKEVEVDHRHREFGKTKYSFLKFIVVIFEVLWLKYLYRMPGEDQNEIFDTTSE